MLRGHGGVLKGDWHETTGILQRTLWLPSGDWGQEWTSQELLYGILNRVVVEGRSELISDVLSFEDRTC